MQYSSHGIIEPLAASRDATLEGNAPSETWFARLQRVYISVWWMHKLERWGDKPHISASSPGSQISDCSAHSRMMQWRLFASLPTTTLTIRDIYRLASSCLASVLWPLVLRMLMVCVSVYFNVRNTIFRTSVCKSDDTNVYQLTTLFLCFILLFILFE